MECCKTCKFWDTEVDKKYFFADGYAFCSRAISGPDVEYGEIGLDSPMVAADASCYNAQLWTKEDHLCKEYRERG